MAAVRIQIDVRELGRLRTRIEKLGKPNTRALLDGVGQSIVDQTIQRFEDEKDPDGKPWEELKDSTKRNLRRQGKLSAHKILQDASFQGGLISSIHHQVHGDTVEVGSNLIYAAIHQFGGAEAGMPQIPARAYLGLSSENMADVLGVVEDFLDDHLGAI